MAGIGTSGVTAISRNYITHNSSGTVGSSSKSWSFTWIAPSPGVGNVNIYAVVNAANGDNGSGGDQIYAKSLTVSELTNGLRLYEEADFGAQNCQHTTKFDARQNVQLTTEPAFLQNRCYRFGVLSFGMVFCVGKDILIDKFWLVRLAFERLGNVYGFR